MELLEQHKHPRDVAASSGGVNKNKGKTVINLTESSDHVENNFVMKKRGLEEDQDGGETTWKRHVGMSTARQPVSALPLDGVFHQ